MKNNLDIQRILNELDIKNECEWLEYKINNSKPDEIGEYISALSNSAALHKKNFGFVVWGINNQGEIVGTNFNPFTSKIGNEELENWLSTQLSPQISFQFAVKNIEGKNLVLLRIESAKTSPVKFKESAYIRIGSYKKKLKDHSDKEKELWKIFDKVPFDETIVEDNVPATRLLQLIDYRTYFQLLNEPIPTETETIIHRLLNERFIEKDLSNNYNITFNCAILLAKELKFFPQLVRKAPRLIIYEGCNRLRAKISIDGSKGYAVGFKGLLGYIVNYLPHNEIIREGIRSEVPLYPEIAIRELIANALIHQDFSIRGAGPSIEIFSDRIEISNPGNPLINPLRFIDEPPITRNERIADVMRRLGLCEERGSGIDKVIVVIELFQLPAPDFRATERSTVATLFAPKPFSEMNRDDRIRACYQHTVLMYLTNKKMSNATLRNRFGIKEESHTIISRIIKDTMDSGLIKQTNVNQSKKGSTYDPFWA